MPDAAQFIPNDRDQEQVAILVKRFWTKYVDDPENPGKKIGRDWVEWVKIGDAMSSTTREAVDRLRPRMRPARTYKNVHGVEQIIGAKNVPARPEWEAIERHYEAWKKGEEMPVDGTPLAAWPGASKEFADELRKLNILTVEDFAEASDTIHSRLSIPGLRDLQKAAKQFIVAQGTTAQTQAELQKRDSEIETLRLQIAELRATITGQASAPEGVELIGQSEDDDDLKSIREELDARGIKWHARAGAAKLRAQLAEAVEAEAA